jgi:non-specific protein-tyrosine kinase
MNGHLGRNEIYRLAPLLYPRSGAAEAYRTLRTNVEFTSVDAPIRTLLVTSAMPAEGKTITASNLALVFAQGGNRVLLVDADLRKPGIHLAFRLDNERGLTTLVRDEGLELDAVAQATEEQNLRVLTTGPLPPNPAELMGSQRMRGVVDRLKGSADLVVFDSPPLQAVSDAAILSSYLDGTLLVIDATRSRRRAVHLGVDALAKAGANVLGVVLNRLPSRLRTDFEAAYGGYYASDEAPRAGRKPEVSGGHSPG